MPPWSLYDKSLPTCEGPKLYPFQDRTATIEFVRLISDQDPVDTSQEGHAHVFEVSILSKPYAVKIVRRELSIMTVLGYMLTESVYAVQILWRPRRLSGSDGWES